LSGPSRDYWQKTQSDFLLLVTGAAWGAVYLAVPGAPSIAGTGHRVSRLGPPFAPCELGMTPGCIREGVGAAAQRIQKKRIRDRHRGRDHRSGRRGAGRPAQRNAYFGSKRMKRRVPVPFDSLLRRQPRGDLIGFFGRSRGAVPPGRCSLMRPTALARP
jgi:hypothetical protein